jgi:hypothetical protein
VISSEPSVLDKYMFLSESSQKKFLLFCASIASGFTKRTLHAVQEVTAHPMDAQPPAALRVVPDRVRFVPSVISSITPVQAVHLPISLLVAIDVVRALFVLKSPHPDRGAVVEIVRAGCTDVSARAREAIEALLRDTVPVVVIGHPVSHVQVATEVTPVAEAVPYSNHVSVAFTFTTLPAHPTYVHGLSQS